MSLRKLTGSERHVDSGGTEGWTGTAKGLDVALGLQFKMEDIPMIHINLNLPKRPWHLDLVRLSVDALRSSRFSVPGLDHHSASCSLASTDEA